MKKCIVSLLVFTCVLLNIAPLFNVNVFAHSDEESGTVSYCESASDSINFDSGNSNVFSPGETISFTYTVRSEYDIVDVSGEAIGFDVIRLEANEEKRIYVTLACDSSVEISTLRISVQLSNGKVLSTSIYGLNNMYGTFISYYEEGALNEYLNYMKSKRYLLEAECVEIKKAYYNQAIAYTYLSMSHDEFNSVNTGFEMQAASMIADTASSTYAWSGGSGNTQIMVYVTWKDKQGIYRSYEGVKVEIYDAEAVGNDELLATLISNSDGAVCFYTDNNDGLFQKGYDIYVKIYAGDGNITVMNSAGVPYVYDGIDEKVENIKDGQVHTFNLMMQKSDEQMGEDEIAETNTLTEAFRIFQAAFAARDFVRYQTGTILTPVSIKYPSNQFGNSCYEFNSSTIYLDTTEQGTTCQAYESWDLITHEYGHHVQNCLGLTDRTIGSLEHKSSENQAVKKNNKLLGIKLAWMESWPTVFGMVAQEYYLDSGEMSYTLDGKYTSNLVETEIEFSPYIKGEACEGSIMAVLWDIFDGTGSESIDSVSRMYTAWWDATTDDKSWTFSDFINYYYILYPSAEEKMKLGKLLTYYKMAPDIREDYSYTGDSNGTVPRIVFELGGDGTVTNGGITESLNNNVIDVLFYDSNYNLILQKNVVPGNTYCSLSSTEWSSIINACNATVSRNYYVCVRGKNIAQGCETGYYYSEPLTLQIP